MSSIRKRILRSGETRWLVDYRDQAGKRRAKQFDTKREAESWKTTALFEVKQGTHVADSASTTVANAAKLWIENCERRCRAGQQMERASLMAYRTHVHCHMLDREIGVGAEKLSRLSKLAVTQFRDRLLEAGRSEPLTRKVITSLRLVLDHAQELQLIGANPADGVKVLKTNRVEKKVTPPSREDVRSLIEKAPEDFRAHVVVAALCGLRASELRALTWGNVDFDAGYIHVTQRADRYNEIGEPKSNAGARSVPIGPFVVNELKRWKLRCPQSEIGLVFPTQCGTVQSQENQMRRRFYPLRRKLGLDSLRWHDLRHFAISSWIDHGFSVKAIQTFAGHTSVQLTMDRYGHLFASPDHHVGMEEVEKRLFV